MSTKTIYSSVKVIIRVRPLVKSESQTNNIVQVQSDNKTLKIYHERINKIQSKFDHIISPEKSQAYVFQQFSPYIPKVFEGYNMTVFAYGQTGSGKTYTMFGSDWENLVGDQLKVKKQATYFENLENDTNFAGIIPRSIKEMFIQFQKNPLKYQLFCSFLQIYNQKIYDLLQDSPQPKALNIHESKANGIFVEGLKEFQVENFADCIELMRNGQKNRHIRQTSMNANSSRSHTIFQIVVESMESDKNGNQVKAKLNLCDLAGSQKINKKQNMVNQHLQELKNINLSLTTLGKVISSLSNGDKKKANINVASFRESKLTRLLQQSLTSNTNTFIIGNISPSDKNFDETLNTLKFSERASHITMKTKPLQYHEYQQGSYESVDKLKKEINYLKQLLNQKRRGLNQDKMTGQISALAGQNQNLKNQAVSATQFQKVKEQNRDMKKQIFKLNQSLEHIKEQLSSERGERSNRSGISEISSRYHLSDFSAKQELRRDIIVDRFSKKANQFHLQNQGKRRGSQKRQRSILLDAGKATIDQSDFTFKDQKEENLERQDHKNSILGRLQKMEAQQNHNDSLIMKQLEVMNQYKVGNKNLINKNQSIDASNIKNLERAKPRKAHEGNIFRKGVQSVQKKLAIDFQPPKLKRGSNKHKIDYSDRIRQLQARLYKK